MKYYKVLIVLFCFPVISGKCQNPVKYRNISLVPIESIDWKSFADEQLKVFDSILSKRDILILSEANHGDGSSYDAQCMILKTLIDSNKVSTIYTESSWINIDRINSLLKEKGKEAIRESIKYMHSTELKYWVDNEFWQFLATKIIENQIKIVGFDIDGVSPLIISELVDEALDKTFDSGSEEIHEMYKAVKFDYDNFGGWNTSSRYGEKEYILQTKFIGQIIKNYTRENNKYRVKQWQSILNFFYWMYKRSLVLTNNKFSNVIENNRQFSDYMAVRDSLMADFFLEHYNDNPNTKAVALMSNYHALRNSSLVQGLRSCCMGSNVKTVGEIINDQLRAKIYSVCFVSASGERGVINYLSKGKPTKILNPIANSLELSLKSLSVRYCMVKLNEGVLRESSFYMCAIFGRYLKSKWSENFDGVFFIKKMEPLVFKNISILDGIER